MLGVSQKECWDLYVRSWSGRKLLGCLEKHRFNWIVSHTVVWLINPEEDVVERLQDEGGNVSYWDFKESQRDPRDRSGPTEAVIIFFGDCEDTIRRVTNDWERI